MNSQEQSKKVMIVDDDPVIRVLVSDYLAAFGHEITVAEGGPACLRRLEEQVPDVLFLDLQMPEMNGLEVLQHIRTNPRTAAVRVIMMSANSLVNNLTSSAAARPRAGDGKGKALQVCIQGCHRPGPAPLQL